MLVRKFAKIFSNVFCISIGQIFTLLEHFYSNPLHGDLTKTEPAKLSPVPMDTLKLH